MIETIKNITVQLVAGIPPTTGCLILLETSIFRGISAVFALRKNTTRKNVTDKVWNELEEFSEGVLYGRISC